MNNGVNNNEQNTLTPMQGVKVVPANTMPVNASNQTPTNVVSNTTQQEPVLVSQPQINNQNIVAQPVTPRPVEIAPPPKEIKKKSFTPILLLIIIILVFYIVYSNNNHQKQIATLKYNCTPITSKEEVKLDLESTLVKDLYSKVQTTIREDIANPNFDDTMKLYLAYRQINERDKYDSNCNQYSNTAMEPFTCEVSTKFVPKAFKEDTLKQEIKKLFGEETNLEYKNIQLGKSCVVGYQYIQSRGEFVEGYCNQNTATSFKVDKKLIEAKSTKNTIILKEDVKYHSNEKMDLPEYLKSGTYIYTFRLDMNYNYVLVSKIYENKYE